MCSNQNGNNCDGAIFDGDGDPIVGRRREYLQALDQKLFERSEELEVLHMQAAMDAQLTDTNTSRSNANPVVSDDSKKANIDEKTSPADSPLFDDYVNPDAVANCFSPYVPTDTRRILGLISFLEECCMSKNHCNQESQNYSTTGGNAHDHQSCNSAAITAARSGDIDDGISDGYFLDIGCGDGRVCVAVAKAMISSNNSSSDDESQLLRRGFCSAFPIQNGTIGLDVSPLCIAQACQLAQEEGLATRSIHSQETHDKSSSSHARCFFYEADATLDPDILLRDSSPLGPLLRRVTCVFLYTYPTLLLKLVPLLYRLQKDYRLRYVVTLTYHLTEDLANVVKADLENDLRMYTDIRQT